MIINTFNGSARSAYAAMDTETKTYVDGKILPDDEIKRMCAEKTADGKAYRYPPEWWREHAEVKCWAWIIWTPEGWAIAENFEEWCDIVVRCRISTAWFYYAPFDFSIIDSECLRRGWTHLEKASAPMTYAEMSNEFGARYILDMCIPAPAEKRGYWRLKMYDLRNIFSGGLAQLLEDFNVTDENGDPIRKLKMDYQNADGEDQNDLEYMKVDAMGLWYLIQEAGEKMLQLYGMDIRGGKPDVLTASGLARKVVLREMYPYTQDKYLLADFQRYHPLNLFRDDFFRRYGLLGGGKVIVNPDYQGKHLTGIAAYRHDVNSEYPWYMSQMRSIYGKLELFPTLEMAQEWHPKTDCFILQISRLCATVKPDMVPAWRDPYTGKTPECYIIEESAPPILMFFEEYEELTTYWYDLISIKIDCVFVYPTRVEPAIRRIMLREYAGKTEAKISGDRGLMTFHKLVMNGYGGKYSQNPNKADTTRALDAAGVVKRGSGPYHASEKDLFHVAQGARITCGGRVHLMEEIRRVCKGNVRKNLLYTDTDSIHSLIKADNTSPTELGALKLENKTPIVRACFLAPKTYYEIEQEGVDAIDSGDAERIEAAIEHGAIELHAKGIHIEEIQRLIQSGVPIEEIYSPGFRVQTLSALNVRGGKALLPFPKSMANLTDVENVDEKYD